MTAVADALMGIFGMKRVKSRKCKVCRSPFQPRSMTHKACSPECAAELAKQDRIKSAVKELRARKLAIKPRSKWLAEAQAAVNAYIRERDKIEPCISCGRFHDGQWHAGHYRSVGAMPALRFDERNIHRQCAPCNNHKSGNVVEYRIRLIVKIGIDAVEWLEGPHEIRKYTVDELKSIKAEYKLKLNAIKDLKIV